MQESPDPLAQLLRQFTDLGGATVMQERQQDAATLGQSQRHAPELTLFLMMAITLPASTIARPVAAPSPANDNVEG